MIDALHNDQDNDASGKSKLTSLIMDLLQCKKLIYFKEEPINGDSGMLLGKKPKHGVSLVFIFEEETGWSRVSEFPSLQIA
jgi:hypothetical protein